MPNLVKLSPCYQNNCDKSALTVLLTDLGAFKPLENKGLKQAQDRSVEVTVNKPPSWVKHMLKNLLGYQASTLSSKRSMPDDLF